METGFIGVSRGILVTTREKKAVVCFVAFSTSDPEVAQKFNFSDV